MCVLGTPHPWQYVVVPEGCVCPPCHAGHLVFCHLHHQLCHRCTIGSCRRASAIHQVLDQPNCNTVNSNILKLRPKHCFKSSMWISSLRLVGKFCNENEKDTEPQCFMLCQAVISHCFNSHWGCDSIFLLWFTATPVQMFRNGVSLVSCLASLPF